MALLVSCSGAGVSARVISTKDTIGVGTQRLLVEIQGPDREPLETSSPPRATLRDENGSPLGEYPGELVWLIPDVEPVYSFVVDIPEAETYQLTVDVEAMGSTAPAGFVAVDNPVQVESGEPAPEVSGEAVRGPALVVFASPDWCPSQSCRPMLEQVEALAERDAQVSWQHVEVFIDPKAESKELSGNVQVWGLPSQPWLYGVDEAGMVVTVFEGGVSDREIEEAISLITSSR